MVALAIRAFVIEAFKIPSGSMIPTLLVGDHIFVNKLAYGPLIPFSKKRLWSAMPPKRGDVIVFAFPENPEEDFIKRVIALPGDTIEIRGGQVYVNDQLIDEPYIRDKAPYLVPRQTVPPDHYFVLGDNRPNSSDSHVWGLVPADNIIGRAWVSYWPPNLWGTVPEPVYAR
jgi:signal peptidase I